MRYLITGGAGFIGSHLAESLLEKGHHVSVIDNLSTGTFDNIEHLTKNDHFHFAIDTIMNDLVMDRLASESNVIFHLASAVGVDLIVKAPVEVIETNILGTHAVLKAACRYKKKVLITSTSEIYGKSTNTPYAENDDRLLGPTTKSRWCYSTTKAVDEFLGLAYCRQKKIPVIIVRLFNTIGPRQTGQYGMVAPRFIENALAGRPLTVYGDGTQSRCFLDVKDCIRALVDLSDLENAPGNIYNIGSTEEVTILELAQRVLKLVDECRDQKRADLPGIKEFAAEEHNERILFLPYEEAYEEGFEDMQQRKPDIFKIKETIGWEPEISLNKTLQRMIQSLTN